MSEDMHILLGRYFSGEATEMEATTVRKWMEESEQNRAEFQLLEKMWNNSGEHTPIRFDTDKAWKKVDEKINTDSKSGKIINMSATRVAIAVAATLVLLFGIWWMTSNNKEMRRVVADNGVREVKLTDGSKVYLRNGAVLEFPGKFAKDSRNVSLTGEAFFEVTPDASKPFIIKAATTEVQVLGTSFTINTGEDSIQLIVKTGRVNFTPAANIAGKMMVIAGERAVFAGGNILKRPNTDPNFNAWQSKQLVFKNTPLSQVAATLSNYFGITIGFKKEDATQLSVAEVTDTFNDQSLLSVLSDLERTTTYSIKKTGDTNYEISIKQQ